jgi:isopentenyl-diphosphate delta-isomerase
LPDRVVSFEDEDLILVDEDDTVIGHLDKGACHDGDGVLHRAFSIFVFSDTGELLLQKRSPEKRLWPGFWSNSCCSHPRRGEEMATALNRRLHDELGMRSELHFLYTFSYHVPFGDAGSEREVCSVYAGRSTDEVRANAHEIAAWRWISAVDLDREMGARPGDFTPWFLQEWQEVRRSYRSVLGFSEET